MNKLTIMIIVIVSFAAFSTTVYVNDDAAGLNNGTSWANAYTSLQSALIVSVSGDQIWVAKGTYKPSYDDGLGLGDRGRHFRMRNGVKIYGGFAGTETAVSQRNMSINETILSGDIGTSGVNSDNCYHVVYNSPQTPKIDSTAVMDGFTVKYGNADGSGPDFNGGGAIYNNDATPIFYNMYITQNTASYGGGINNYQNAFYYDMPRVRYYNLLVTDNYSAGNGGGIYDDFSKAHYFNATVVNNRSESAAGGHYAVWAYSDIFNSIIMDNEAGTDGNDIYYSGIYRMYNCNYSITSGDVFNAGGASLTPVNCINSDPAFVDTGSGDYRLSALSPCINSGNNNYNSYSTEIRGSARIQEGTIDMGAFERIAGTDPFGIYYVTAAGSGAKNGKSWADAMEGIQTALTAAVSGDRIWVEKGTYKPSYDNGLGLGERGNHFQMKNELRIFGGFSGSETSESQRTDFGTGGTKETILSGDIGTPGVNTDNCYHVIYNPDMSPDINNTAVIDGFTVTGGYADGTAPHNNGGGIHNSISTPYYMNISVVNNYAAGVGGGIFNSGTSSTPDGPASKYVNVLIAGNSSVSNGGGASEGLSTADYINCTIAYNNSGASGGGISSFASNTRLKNCILWGNHASGDGDQINLGFTSCYLDYTCYSNSAGDVYGGFTTGGGNITSNPAFADPACGDYRLYGFSPCINSGYNSYNTASTDLRGQVRIQNGTIDMGAYEWTSGIDPENLIAPADITIGRSADSTQLSWTAAPGAASYKIYRSIDPYSGFTQINTSATNSYTDSEVLSGNKYFYYVVAVSGK